ncbi:MULTISPECIES: acyl-CoA carboxylase subunit beta [Pseudothermotoga]|jgi:acetyl-CoA carboxylase carboxyltransferase component|uniref:Carboxyl transferase n=3 Tax=Pseudothermotoga TaxID=1643951 RepID=A8F3L3_PSELT|nr:MULTISPECIES: acyl-CoA carboxylase subunit beta [Pseudothermotoga]ABV32747.1 carboxyl transferase [Pseudothermotoga lettingae TMO]MDK2885245.1 methylmalonyl-CoA decarboxylase subunit alpha [Pseudothermotoga sp.]GLI48259.1 propionyl-CoA carboxylase subunit beta [Pseudothermotoga lettingae TMO]HBJ80486.1 acyl-CoA carboxylase subunit beta [Pseudothermotoga sp.]
MEEFINKLHQLDQHIEKGGGDDRIAKQHAQGKLTARERISLLLDAGSFVEIDKFVRHRSTLLGMDKEDLPADGVVTGIGRIDGRSVAIFSQDFTVMGGSLGEMHAKKIMKIMDLAMELGIPLIGINDSGGARIQEGVDSLYGYGGIFYRNTIASGLIPQITLIAGPCAGGAVYSPAITDFVVMIDKTSRMFITGPNVIKAVTGEEISQEDLGGGYVHNAKSGNAHFLASDEQDAVNIVRKLLSYIPQNNLEEPECIPGNYETTISEEILSTVPVESNKGYDVRNVINLVVDQGSFFEVHKHYAKNIVVGFARIFGKSVGLIANQPSVLAGALDIDSSDKAARFIRFLDAFNIPIVTFVDTPGYLPGVQQEHGGIIRHGAKLLYAYSEATVPKITVILRKAYGGAYIAMGSKHLEADFVAAWPTAEIAVMGPEGAANIIFRKDIESAPNPEEKRKELVQMYKETFANPYVAASRGYIDAVIDPRQTRDWLIKVIDICQTKVRSLPKKKHGNIPL